MMVGCDGSPRLSASPLVAPLDAILPHPSLVSPAVYFSLQFLHEWDVKCHQNTLCMHTHCLHRHSQKWCSMVSEFKPRHPERHGVGHSWASSVVFTPSSLPKPYKHGFHNLEFRTNLKIPGSVKMTIACFHDMRTDLAVAVARIN